MKSLDIAVSSVFTIHLLKNCCKITVSIMNTIRGMSSNDLTSDANVWERDGSADSCRFILCSSNEATHTLIMCNRLCNDNLFCKWKISNCITHVITNNL